jgi:DNA (cytosine-5)-methyltransferase 1
MVFHEVCADLENIGYEVQAFIIPASGINAPHQRERLWIVAHSINGGYSVRREQNAEEDRLQEQYRSAMDCREFNRTSISSISANSNLHGFHKRNGNNEINASERGFNALNDIDQSNGIWNVADTESQRTWEQSSENRGREDGRFNDISEDGDATDTNGIGLWGKDDRIRESKFNGKNYARNNWQNFPTQSPVCGGDDGISYGLDNITFPKWRNESIKGYGNAVVPQVVYRIFKTIEYIQNINDNTQSKN